MEEKRKILDSWHRSIVALLWSRIKVDQMSIMICDWQGNEHKPECDEPWYKSGSYRLSLYFLFLFCNFTLLAAGLLDYLTLMDYI